MTIRTHHKRYIMGHVEIYDAMGNFVVSGDTDAEAETNLAEILAAREIASGNNCIA
jgi:hypothetical protein